MIRGLAAGCVIWCSPAQAMLAPCVYDGMIGSASDVVQIVEIEVDGPDAEGFCGLTGVVARSFRGGYTVGDKVALVIACANVNNLVGAQIYLDPEGMRSAEVIELHLIGSGIAAYGAGMFSLPTPTDRVHWQTECRGD